MQNKYQTIQASPQNTTSENTTSENITSENTTGLQLEQQQISQKTQVILNIDAQRSEYGRMIVLCRWPILITVGPDYLCFLMGFCFFALLAYFLCQAVTAVFENVSVIFFTYLISFLQCGSYLLVAISNPGVALRSQNSIKQVTTQNQHRVCKKCGAQKKNKTYHCRECDVCIEGYDHHCPWTSKCIGSGNLYRFYAFVSITPVYIILFMGLMMGCLMISAQNANANLKANPV